MNGNKVIKHCQSGNNLQELVSTYWIATTDEGYHRYCDLQGAACRRSDYAPSCRVIVADVHVEPPGDLLPARCSVATVTLLTAFCVPSSMTIAIVIFSVDSVVEAARDAQFAQATAR